MTSLAANTLLWGSGLPMSMARAMPASGPRSRRWRGACGREDDVQVLNFLTGSTDVDPHGPGAAAVQHLQPVLARLGGRHHPTADRANGRAGGDSATWKDKAIGLLTAYVRTLVAMRDRGRDEQNRPFTSMSARCGPICPWIT